VQRMPRCRWGFVHVVNNDYTHWLMYAIGGSQHPTIISEGNRFIAPPDLAAKEVYSFEKLNLEKTSFITYYFLYFCNHTIKF
jgi:pectate lyase